MQGMLKEVPIARPDPVINTTPSPSVGVPDQLPMEMYHYFNENPAYLDRNTGRYIGEIYSWAKKDAKTLGDVMGKISTLENKMGQPKLDETRTSRIYNYVRMQRSVDAINEERDRVSSMIKSRYGEERKKILSDIKRKENRELKKVETQVAPKLEELGKLKQIYGGV